MYLFQAGYKVPVKMSRLYSNMITETHQNIIAVIKCRKNREPWVVYQSGLGGLKRQALWPTCPAFKVFTSSFQYHWEDFVPFLISLCNSNYLHVVNIEWYRFTKCLKWALDFFIFWWGLIVTIQGVFF